MPDDDDQPPEQPSLRQIFDEHARFAWRALRHLGVRDADIEDVVQEVFIAVDRKLPEFEWRSSLSTWVYGICLRTASDYRRRAYVRREQPVPEPPAGAVDASQIDELALEEARGLLLQILDGLDDEKRQVFVLYEIEGLPMKAIASIVGCPLQTAYSRLHAARRLVNEAARALQGDAREDSR